MVRLRYISMAVVLSSLCILPGCNENGIDADRKYRLYAGCLYKSDECFADQKLTVRVGFVDPDGIPGNTQLRVNFGDGQTALTQKPPGNSGDSIAYSATLSHQYEKAGTYSIVLQDINGRPLADTTVTFRKAPKRLKSHAFTTYSPKYMWQGSSNEYYLVHTVKTPGDEWAITKLTSSLDSVSTGTSFADMKGYATNFVTLPSGNLVQVRDGAVEQFDNTGKVLSHTELNIQKVKYRQIDLATTNDRLLIASDSRYEIVITTLNLSDNSFSNNTISKSVNSFDTVIKFLSSGDIASTAAYSDPSQPRRLFVYNADRSEKASITLPRPAFKIYPVDDGMVVLLLGENTFQGILKLDTKGTLVWNLDWTFRTIDYGLAAFTDSGTTWLFFDNMTGARIDAAGHAIWYKRFATSVDRFQSAIINKAGNFILVGERPCDFLMEDKFPCTTRTISDRILIEVDKDGNIIDH